MTSRISERFPLRTEEPQTTGVPRAWLTAVVAVGAVAVLYTAQAHVPKNVLTLPGQQQVAGGVHAVAPQGWAFFTKSPRDPELVPYRYAGTSWKTVSMGPHSRPSNAFGLDRASRSQGIEMALLLNEAPELKWTECEDHPDVETCLESITSASADGPARIRNRSPEPTLCGTVAIVQAEPVPWAWRDLMDATHTPGRAAVWEVTC
ncbi:SdpA family antimicrobial peptide system protein [Streptomyces paludis]|uniref:SdpA family antimicrobial peptide system protein n=1 Tax=Streptomyces paludis TaxID=2282738 RepID=A0A345HUJ6_9ACTN|nr:SdpA family antimicrobial peptide system protein [Streptomyces paludis]AXG80370.1 SdpA family antimicrobial peptide system protein [Streptomyces paludis]